MKRYGTLTLAAVLAIALDTAVLSAHTLWGVRPWVLLAVARVEGDTRVQIGTHRGVLFGFGLGAVSVYKTQPSEGAASVGACLGRGAAARADRMAVFLLAERAVRRVENAADRRFAVRGCDGAVRSAVP